jgi:hypothetical protein
MARLLAFRDRWSGTVQDVCAAMAMLVFLGSFGFWLAVLS